MTNRLKAVLLGLLLMFAGVSSVLAQTSRPGGSEADLTVRIKEAEANPKLADELYRTGQKVAAFCGNCHGDGGNSANPEIPNLAGQNPAYLLDQLQQFSQGRRRNEFMEGMIKALKSDEKVGIVLFYARQRVQGNRANAAPALVAKGREIYGKNCWRCHAADGRGNEKFARIAGQQTGYLAATIKRYRTGVGARTDPLMAANTKLLTDADIEAIVAYVSSMD